MLHWENLLYVSKIIKLKLINKHYNDSLEGQFRIEKTCELIARKYYSPTLEHNVETYLKGSVVCLAYMVVCHKPYSNLQSMPVPIYHEKDLSLNFLIGLLISTNWKKNSFNLVLVIIDRLKKRIYYNLVKVNIDLLCLRKVIINIVHRQYGLSDWIVSDCRSVLGSKFCSLIYYFLSIK